MDMRWKDPTKNEDGSKKKCQCCGKPLERLYYDKEDGKEKCKECYDAEPNKISIHKPNGLHGWGLQFQSDDIELIKKYVRLCNIELDSKLLKFHQTGLLPNGELANYQYFEFWGVHEQDEKSIDLMVNECLRIASLMGLELEID